MAEIQQKVFDGDFRHALDELCDSIQFKYWFAVADKCIPGSALQKSVIKFLNSWERLYLELKKAVWRM